MGKLGKEYLVEGAKLWCSQGSKQAVLKIPKGHGYTSGGKKKANCKDCKPLVNIPCFGECRKNKTTGTCKGYMLLAKQWESIGGFSARSEKVGGQKAITMDSVLICKKGGLIMPLTSGQGYNGRINWLAFLARMRKAERWAKGAHPEYNICLKDPINMNTGNYIYEKEELVIPGITTLSFRLFYNSMEKGPGGCIGEGWHHNYEMHIKQEENGKMLYVCCGDGQEIPYRQAIGDVYVPVFGDRGLLKREGNGFYYCTSDRMEYMFGTDGLLLSQKDGDGNTDIFTYNRQGQLIKVSGANGGELYYTYNSEGSLIRVKDHTGREIQLWYKYRKLWKFINASGYAYFYDYNPNGKLESVVTPRGIKGVFNEYDSADRVLKQTTPDGGIVELMYDDENMRTYMREQNGNMVSFESDDRCRNIRTVYEDGEETFEYNDSNQRILYVDKNGNRTRYRYDEKGNLTGIVDALGNQTEYFYDTEGHMTGVKQPGGGCISYTYNQVGKQVKIVDALGRSRETAYNEKGLPVCITQPDGSNIQLTHDDRGNLASITDPYGGTTTYTYDALNRVESTTDAEGNVVRYRYDERNHLTEVTDPAGNHRRYTYNESGKPICVQDFDGNEIHIEYECMNKPELLTDKEGRVIKRRYDHMGNLAEEIIPSGAVITYAYDKSNRLVRVEMRKEQGATEPTTVFTYAYDPVGNLLRSGKGDGQETISESVYVYDALNRITEITDPVGGKTMYAYDEAGRVSSITDPAGNKRSFVYNEAGERIQETDIRGNITRYTYNALGQISTITDGAGRITRYYYQQGGRPEKVEYPDGKELSYTYDSLGRIRTRTDGNGYRLTYHYDCMGRLLRVNSSAGQEKSYTYDVLGNVTSVTDAGGNTTNYEYSVNGKLTAVTDALGNRAEYAYDMADNLIHVCQKGNGKEESRETFYERNAFGQIEVTRDALGSEERYDYDALGRTTKKIDKEGYLTTYAYAADGKIERVVYADNTSVEMEYTALRQLAGVRDWLGETKIERSLEGNPIQIINHKGRSVYYEWGNMGERRSITYPDGKKVRYGYDNLLRMNELIREESGKENLRITYQYDSQGRLSEKRMPGNLSTHWKYNQLGLPVEMIHEDSVGILDRYCYGYDDMGNRIRIEKERRGLVQESGSYSFLYDALNRLEMVEKDGKEWRKYAYDSFGNRIGREDYEKGRRTAYTYDALNRLLTEEIWEESIRIGKEAGNGIADVNVLIADVVKNYEYDLRGNLVAEYQGERLLHGYTYNPMNRLEKAWDESGRESCYHYNGLGQRIGRCADGIKEEYLLDLTKPYHNLLEYRKGEVKQNFYWDVTAAVLEEDGRSPRYYLNDELGSPLRVVYGTGKGDVYGYDEFGNDLSMTQTESEFGITYSRQGEAQPFGYTGYRYDEIAGTYFAQAREYVPGMGRFAAEDVIRGNGVVPKTLNRYGYCWENPINIIDRNGMKGYYFYDPDIYVENNINTENIVAQDIEYLEEKYDAEIETIPMDTENNPDYTTFEDAWNNMDEDVKVVVILTHSNDHHFVTDSSVNSEGERNTDTYVERKGIVGLDKKNIGTMYLLGCNMGLTNPREGKNSLASTFYAKENRQNIGTIIASDGSIMHGIDVYGKRILYAEPSDDYHPGGKFDGFKKYYWKDGKLMVEKIEDMRLYMEHISSRGYEGECGGKGDKKKDEKKKK